MYLREARLSDMQTVGRIGARAFIDDPLFNAVEPGRYTYYEDYEAGWVRRVREKALKPEARIVLAVDEETKEITGFAVWVREGDDPAAYRWRNEAGILKRIEFKLLTIEGRITTLFSPKSRSEDPAALARLDEATEQATTGTWSQEGRKIRWHLHILGVDPSWRRRGVGRLLVSWGMKNGAKEGVICSLESSPTGRALYEKLGFKAIDVWAPFEGFKEEFENITAPMMVWQPGAAKGNGVAKAKTENGIAIEDGSVNGARKSNDME
ncbi:acyl-CoA N-acyltransferase [Tuber magnatum]|uniref:Acyl-CoA N-acyltransferase n=1 Tax=Tuber magnatum TaxID=42249 RepID=A0A317T154_9PEZI|nr:acyl-CoA N-acyltransferase [Tuber magnatum]